MKFKSKIRYLGEKNSILPWQMNEQLAVEVEVKKSQMEYGRRNSTEDKGQAPLFGLDSNLV